MSEPDWNRYKNFSRAEFVCKCGCDQAEMDPEFMELLQLLRNAHGKALPVNSGYRCPEYNDKVSSTGRDGPHTTGQAVDLGIMGADAYHVLSISRALGFTGVGVAQKGAHRGRFLHLDTLGGDTRPWVWSY